MDRGRPSGRTRLEAILREQQMKESKNPVLYLGDTSLDTAASYLAGVMTHFEIGFDYVASDEAADRFLSDEAEYRLIILSDYPAGSLEPDQIKRIEAWVRKGTGLLMVGGWESFQGSGGHYNGTQIEEILPVRILPFDDRVNASYPCLVCKREEHPILANLPFDRPPCIGGYNRVEAKEDARILLEVIRYRTRAKASSCSFAEEGRDVLLAVGEHGLGRSAAFTSDAAPHWVGGFVDWGEERLSCTVAETEVEVGAFYAEFFKNLIRWTGRLTAQPSSRSRH
jgi:uncharacterized membrane protein